MLGCVGCTGGDACQSVDNWTLDGQPVQLPVHLGSRVTGRSAYVLQTHVVVASAVRGGPLTLSIGWLPAIASLRVSGRPVPPLDAPLSDRFRSAGPHRWRIPDDLA